MVQHFEIHEFVVRSHNHEVVEFDRVEAGNGTFGLRIDDDEEHVVLRVLLGPSDPVVGFGPLFGPHCSLGHVGDAVATGT